MTSQQLEEQSQQLEARVATLETELIQMKQMLSGLLQNQNPWWLKVAGSFENDLTFDEAVRLGQEWRKSAEQVASIPNSFIQRNSEDGKRILTRLVTVEEVAVTC
ncbi:hypothetical protein [Halotia branconii]|uniref:Uncharacterized protein n=1 Tax=Halotia branconii CENA392 TaxID=1539056 RepID=A0AAJ6PB54_9CYAN|nr:hypothetical protein [Halotia branconii]WGV27461.1 hypothetical protein QI031_08235 [Halotia branconii CENA392]